MIRAHYFQHVPFEGLGSIGTSLDRRGAEITSTAFFETPNLPSLDDLDLLIIMGGPMSVNHEQAYPWLRAEKQFISDAIEAGKAVLGVCLGAQLIATALGSRVYPNRLAEIGWFPIQSTYVAKKPGDFSFPELLSVFHWHGETFDLPPGCVRLARSAVCENQGFKLGAKVIGLQFHLESTPSLVRQMVENCRSELVPGQYIQAESEILAAGTERYLETNQVMDDILSYILSSTDQP